MVVVVPRAGSAIQSPLFPERPEKESREFRMGHVHFLPNCNRDDYVAQLMYPRLLVIGHHSH